MRTAPKQRDKYTVRVRLFIGWSPGSLTKDGRARMITNPLLFSDRLILARHYDVYAKYSVRFYPDSTVAHLALVTQSIAVREPG